MEKSRRLQSVFSLALALAMLAVFFQFTPVVAYASAGEDALAPTNLRINLLSEAYNVPLSSDPSFAWTFNAEGYDQVQTAYQMEIANGAGESVYASGWTETSETRVYVPADTFADNALYAWRVRTQDKDGSESPWSEWVPFVTEIGGEWADRTGIWNTPSTTGAVMPTFTDMTMEADLILTGGNAFGVSLRGTNANNMFMIQYRYDQNAIVPHRGNNSGLSADASVTLADKGIALEQNKMFRTKLTISGDTAETKIKIWIDMLEGAPGANYVEVCELSYTNNHANLSQGGFGFRTGGSEYGSVDYIKVVDDTKTEDNLVYESNFSITYPNPFSGSTISNGRLNIPNGQSGGIFYNPGVDQTEKGNFVFMRHGFSLEDADNIEKAVLSGTAYTVESGTGNDALSYVYDLFVNGESVGVGPARLHKYNGSGGSATPISDYSGNIYYYNSFDVTELLQNGDNVIAASNYSRNSSGSNPSKSVLFQMTVFYKDGTKQVLVNSGRDSDQWLVKDGTASFGDSGDISTNNYMRQSREDMNGLAYPYGWTTVSFAEDDSWKPATRKSEIPRASTTGSSVNTLEPYGAENTLRYDVPAQSVTTVVGSTGKTFQVVDLGKEIVGGLKLTINNTTGQAFALTVQSGESLIKTYDPSASNTTNFDAANAPYGSVRYSGWSDNPIYDETWIIAPGYNELPTTLMKTFRWVQFVDAPIEITPDMVTGLSIRQEFDDDISYIEAPDNEFFNDLVELVKYSIKATNQDQYTDSYSRERRAYEGDLILNQYGSYAFSDNYALARHTGEYLIDWPTWPPEYRLFSIEMAWADYLYTGDKTSLEKYYEQLDRKLPTSRDGTSYRITTSSGTAGTTSEFVEAFNLCRDNNGAQSSGAIVDWPAAEQDGYRRSGGTNATGALSGTGANGSFTTVYNAVAYGAYCDMANIANALGKTGDAAIYQEYADKIKASLIEKLYNEETGAFHDSISAAGRSAHCAQHATAYALAYGIYTDQAMADKMVDFLRTFDQGGTDGFLRSSVYGTYFVLRGLYDANAGDLASRVMLEEDPDVVRSWAHMLYRQQATITTEAWSPDNKNNMTYSHPWGSTPGALITQGIFGIKPLEPGFDLFQIKFQPGDTLKQASIKSPTVKGAILASFDQSDGFLTGASVTIPANSRAVVSLPVYGLSALYVNGEIAENAAFTDGGFMTVELGSGEYELRVEAPDVTEIEAKIDKTDIYFGDLAEAYKYAGANITVSGTLGSGESINIPLAALEYTSMNGNVTVEDGKVTGVSEGPDTITIAVKGAPDVLDTIDVNVYNHGADVIESIKFPSSNPYFVGENVTLVVNATLNNGSTIALENFDGITWESSDPDVAAISDMGLFSARALGETIITASLTSDPAITYSAEFSVEPGVGEDNTRLIKVPVGDTYGRTEGQWESGDPPRNAYDSSTSSFYDGQNGGWAGFDSEGLYRPAVVRFYPRSGFASRMTGNYFQGTNVDPDEATDEDWTTLYVITALPSESTWNSGSILHSVNATEDAFRYFRIFSGDSEYCNVAEVEFYYLSIGRPELLALMDRVSNMDERAYTTESWAALQEVLAKASQVANNPDATKEEIIEAYDNLQAAIVSLKESLTLSTAAHLVAQGDDFEVNASFAQVMNSNTVVLNYTFDGDKFAFAGYNPANGVGVVTSEAGDGYAKITLMVQSYQAEDLGELVLHTKENAVLSKEKQSVSVVADYVLKDENDEKTITAAIATVSFVTLGDGTEEPVVKGDTNGDGVVNLIDLSNMIDWFGITDSDSGWEDRYAYFDFNNNGEIDIYDIVYVAKLIAG